MDFCPNCGAKGVGAFVFCPNCGKALSPAEGATSREQPVGYWAQTENRKRASRTKTGLLLLFIGTLLALVPFVGFVGGVLALIGAILVIAGRKAFGQRHANFVIAAVVIYIVSIIVYSAAVLVAVLNAIDLTSGTPDSASLETAIAGVIWMTLPLQVATGAAVVLFVWNLESETGKVVLIAAFLVSLVAAAIMVYVLSDLVGGVVSGDPTGPGFGQLQMSAMLWGLLLSAPGEILWAIAYYIPYKRIERGEIPEGLTRIGARPPAYVAPGQPPP